MAWVNCHIPVLGKGNWEGITSAHPRVCSYGESLCPCWKECGKKMSQVRWKLRYSLSPFLFQAPQESHYLQFSFLNVCRKAVIICLAEAGQARTSAGPVRVSLHLSHTLLEADSSLPLPLQGQLSLHCRNMPQLAPPFPHPFALPLWIIKMILHDTNIHTRAAAQLSGWSQSQLWVPQTCHHRQEYCRVAGKDVLFFWFRNHEILKACVSPWV